MIRNEIENVTFEVKLLMKVTPDFKQKFTEYDYYKKSVYNMKDD